MNLADRALAISCIDKIADEVEALRTQVSNLQKHNIKLTTQNKELYVALRDKQREVDCLLNASKERNYEKVV